MPKIIREITFEGTEEQLRRQMENSLRDGEYPYMTTITVRTLHSDVPGLTGQNPKGWHKEMTG